METAQMVIPIETIHETIFHDSNRDKYPSDYYLVLPSKWVDTFAQTPIEDVTLLSLGAEYTVMRTAIDVSKAKTCFGYEIIIDPTSEIKLISRNGYKPTDTPLPFDEGA